MIFFIFLSFFTKATPQFIVLYPGARESVEVGRSPITVDTKGILTIKDSGSRLQLIGKKTGTTKITTAKKTINISVVRQETYRTYQRLKQWAENKLGPQITIHSGEVILIGKILTFDDWSSLHSALTEQDRFSMQAQVSDKIHAQINAHLQSLLEKHQLPFSKIVTNGKWQMYLSKSQKTDLDIYKRVLSRFGITATPSHFILSGTPMVEINIVAAEVKKSDMASLGIQWPAQTALTPFSDQILDKTNWILTLNHMESNGWGKILASPTLVTQSGEEATFHSGGEFPIRTANQFNTAISWKKYGIMMRIKPLVDFSGKIDVLVECEVSVIDGSTLIDNTPGLLTNKITSRFNLTESRTIALSGLIKEEWGRSKNGLPGVKDIPLLGQLFKSSNYMNNKSELMFFVTPKILK
jgi:pilus assembly protein CpaC